MRQKGFTLIEVMVAMAVGGMLMAGIVVAIHQVVWGTSRSNSQVVALTDVNHAALMLKKDLQMAQSTGNLTGVSQSTVELRWIDYTGFAVEENRNHSSTYVLSGTELQRTYDGTMSIVGRNITSVEFTRNSRVVSVVITATGPGAQQRSETLKFSVYTRTVEAE